MSITEIQTQVRKLEEILSRENLDKAWSVVKRNDGAAGVDRKTISATDEHLKQHWPDILDKLMAGQYKPAAIRAVQIPKANGGIRTLGIPTVQDRLIQQAIHQVLSAELDPLMSEHSYGFRPKRSAHDAVSAARAHVAQGKSWVVDIDLKSFFDQVNHDRLMSLLGKQIRDKRVLALIGRYLRAPLRQADGTQQKRDRGTPQGGPLSPLLANIYLDPMDKELEKRGIAFVRYADDIALFLSSERAAQRVLESLKEWLKKHLDLEINEDKSGAGPSSGSGLLGFRIHESGDVSIAPKALQKLKEKVRQLWDARQSLSSQELRGQWQRYIGGWWNYFRYANWQSEVKKLSGWIRRHMRKCFWLRWHNRAGRRNALQRLGVKGRALGVASCRRGAWRMARHVVVQQALKTQTLNRYGFALPWALAG
jgi:RNA-directed DNA polymerase